MKFVSIEEAIKFITEMYLNCTMLKVIKGIVT